jgi:hypothetical protein
MTTSLLALSLLILATAARADVVELTTGQKVEGVFKGADDDSVKIERAGQVLMFKRERVRAIYYGPISPSSASPRPPGAEALDVLKTLHTLTASGPGYTQYLGRVVYAQFRIDEQLMLPEMSDRTLRKTVSSSMALYTGAGRIWTAVQQAQAGGGSTKEQAQEVRLAIRPYQEDCPALIHLQDPAVHPDEALAGGVPAAWSCAADKIAELEAIVAGERK